MGSLSSVAGKFAKNEVELDIVTFATSKQGLNQKLFPAQRCILKVLTKMSLDNTVRDIEVRDKFNEKVIAVFTEQEFYDYLTDDGRTSMTYEEYLESPYVVQYQIVMGRRASKSTMIGILAAYMLYIVLLKENPQEYFGIIDSDSMDGTIIALGESNAKKLFSKFTKLVLSSQFFKPFFKEEPTATELKIWTRKDLRKLAEAGGRVTNLSNSITIRAMPNSPQARGDNNLFVIMEEFAHYNTSSSSTREQPLDEMIYEATTPSTSGFKNPDGTPFGRVFIISSPNGKVGKFYKEVEASYEHKGNSGSLTLRAATWEINPSISPAYLRAQYTKNRSSFDQEFGSEFLDGGMSWLQDLGTFYRSLKKSNDGNSMFGRVDRVYFLGVDFALSNDGTACTVSHLEPKFARLAEEIVQEAYSYSEGKEIEDFLGVLKDCYYVDYSVARYAGQAPYENRKVLLIDEVLDWIEEIYTRFPIQAGMYDQWSGAVITQLIEKRKIPRLSMVNHSAIVNDSQYKTFSQILHSDSLVLPYEKPLSKELLGLKCTTRSGGIISVEAPAGAGFHDDRFDSIIRSLQLAFAYHTKDISIGNLLKIEGLFKNQLSGMAKTLSDRAYANYSGRGVSPRSLAFNNNRITRVTR